MTHRTHADDPVPAFKMTLAVPGEGRDPVTLAYAEPVQDGGDGPRPVIERIIAEPFDRSVRRSRHHLAAGVPFCSMGKKLVERQCIVLH